MVNPELNSDQFKQKSSLLIYIGILATDATAVLQMWILKICLKANITAFFSFACINSFMLMLFFHKT